VYSYEPWYLITDDLSHDYSSVVVTLFYVSLCAVLPGDIGGAMGLFIGASMLTILEIIDLFLIQLPIFKRRT